MNAINKLITHKLKDHKLKDLFTSSNLFATSICFSRKTNLTMSFIPYKKGLKNSIRGQAKVAVKDNNLEHEHAFTLSQHVFALSSQNQTVHNGQRETENLKDHSQLSTFPFLPQLLQSHGHFSHLVSAHTSAALQTNVQ